MLKKWRTKKQCKSSGVKFLALGKDDRAFNSRKKFNPFEPSGDKAFEESYSMQRIAYIFLALVSSASAMFSANAETILPCNSYTALCGSPEVREHQAQSSSETTLQAALATAKANTHGICKATADTKENAYHNFSVYICRIPTKEDIAAAKAKAAAIKTAAALAADPTSSLDCKKLKSDSSAAAKASGNPDAYADVVTDPSYYYDSMKGVRATWARLNDFVTNGSASSYDQNQALKSLSQMTGWLAPTEHQYHQVNDILGQLNSCFSSDCKRTSLNDLDTGKTLAKVKEAMAAIQGIEKDMKSKLALLKPCDPVVQTATLKASIAKLQGQFTRNKNTIDTLTKSATCESSTAAAAPWPTTSIPDLIKNMAPAPAPKINVIQGPAPASAPATVPAPPSSKDDDLTEAPNPRSVDANDDDLTEKKQ